MVLFYDVFRKELTNQEKFICDYINTDKTIKALCAEYHVSDRFLYKCIKDGTVPNRKDRHSDSYNRIISNDELKFYLFGLVAADGCMWKNKSTIEISLQSDDRAILEMLSYSIYSTDRVLFRHTAHKPQCRLFLYGDDVYNMFCNVGIAPQKSKDLHINFSKIPDNYFIDFFRGYFDGDGSYHYFNQNKIHVSIGCNEYMAYSFQKKIKDIFDIDSHVYYTPSAKVSFPWYRWTIAKKCNAVALINELYRDKQYFMERKRNIVKSFISAD